MTAPNGSSERPNPEPAMHIIRRADGQEMGEFAFFATDGPEGWDVAENTDHDEDTVYEILACYPVARRKMLWSTLCQTCDGEGDGCPACAGSGEQEPPEPERIPSPPSPVEDGRPDTAVLRARCVEDEHWIDQIQAPCSEAELLDLLDWIDAHTAAAHSSTGTGDDGSGTAGELGAVS